MFENLHLNSLRGALIIGAFSSALAAPTLMSASHYARDVPNQLEPANAPVQGPHLAARTPGLDLMAGLDSAHNNFDEDWNQEVVDDDKSLIFVSHDVRQVSAGHTQLRRRMENAMSRTAEQWRYMADFHRGEIAKLQSKANTVQLELWETQFKRHPSSTSTGGHDNSAEFGEHEKNLQFHLQSIQEWIEGHEKEVAKYEQLAEERSRAS
ncbi:hypothetical protein F5880DRAFT_1734828 [Lentinula raphanica]|nr:hypothetical protein F5880DRAFT_1734828 [Lentinula raphanica]